MASLMEEALRLLASGYFCMQITIKGWANNKVFILPVFVSHAKHKLSVSETIFPEVKEGKDPRVSGF